MSLTKSLIKGASAGARATLPMTAIIWALHRLNMLGEPPPRRITHRLLRATGIRPRRPLLSGGWLLNHFGFGAAAGALFTPLAARVRSRPARVAVGALYGAAVWAGMYGYLLPALGLMPRPQRDRPGRPLSMAIAHLVYGGTLGAVVSGTHDGDGEWNSPPHSDWH
jgi:hypothetical protein